jgi:DNA-binding transcriptional regulator YiaG
MSAKKMGAPLKIPPLTGDPARDMVIELRGLLKISQNQLGAEIGSTGASIRDWESGRSSPAGPTRKALESLLAKARRQKKKS